MKLFKLTIIEAKQGMISTHRTGFALHPNLANFDF